MIRTIKSRGLRVMHEDSNERYVAPRHVGKLRRILTLLETARSPQDMDVPGYRLHPLRGELQGHHAVWVSGNWRVTFRFEAGDVYDVDYVDYH